MNSFDAIYKLRRGGEGKEGEIGSAKIRSDRRRQDPDNEEFIDPGKADQGMSKTGRKQKKKGKNWVLQK